jgi:pimeloyl-ACP methyl ester carboxylesterase
MTTLLERSIAVNGHTCRIWEKGSGPIVGYLAGVLGAPRWTPFLERLSQTHRVVVPSLPGFPGADGHEDLDDIADWVVATLDLLEGSGLSGQDLIGSSIGGALAAEAAAFSSGIASRLVLIAPLGLHDSRIPLTNFWALPPKEMNQTVATRRDQVSEMLACPKGADETEWTVTSRRAVTAGARLFWPLADVGLQKRLHRVRVPSCVVWGDRDCVIDPSYAEIFARKLGGKSTVHIVANAGHLADWDEPDRVADVVEAFLT